MEQLKPREENLWFCWQFFSRLSDWMQRQLAEDHAPVRELAARVDKLLQKAPVTATVAAAPVAEVAAVH